MNRWKLIATENIEVPVRLSGNTITSHFIDFEIFKDGTMYKAVPICNNEQKRLANLKDEIMFAFRPDKAVAANGILDGNQHIVEQIGTILREKGLAE